MIDLPFVQINLVDFEFTPPSGERPIPICMVRRELRTGQLDRIWLVDDQPVNPPFDTSEDSLLVAYYASAELSCFLALGWPMPLRVLDLCAEFRNLTSGLSVPGGRGLLGAMMSFGLDSLTAVEKEEMRQLAIRGSPFSDAERLALTDYCQTDVDALARLFPLMLPWIVPPTLNPGERYKALGQSLLRGRYMTAAARMEWHGVPIDTEALATLREQWNAIKGKLIRAVNADYGVYVPTGQRTINPQSTLGSAILQTAAEWDIDPYRLVDAVDHVWSMERDSKAESREARRAARQATGLTVNRIRQFEESGKDYSLFPGLDELARDIAGTFPELGIPNAIHTEGGVDDVDHAGLLWEQLRDRDEAVKPKHHPDILRQAAEMVVASPDDGHDHFRPMTFSVKRWEDYLIRTGLPWPLLASGELALDDDSFKEMVHAYPKEIGPIRELRYALGQLRLQNLAVGADGRNRCLLSAFASKTSRNQPSNSKFIFGPSTWARSLIRPEPGRAVAYCDWSQQELAIAAALSGDPVMQEAYISGDFYLTFAKMAGAVPPDATKKTHAAEREQFKVVSLGVLYGLSAWGLGRRLNVPSYRGRSLLEMHQRTFRRFWEWSDQIEIEGMLLGKLWTVFGWTVRAGTDANPRSMRNFPMQGNGAEMMRLACCLATERGIRVCAPVHDALLVEGPIDEIEDVVTATQAAMREASETVLPGFPLRTDAKIVKYPNRYSDPRGEKMWELVWSLIDKSDLCHADTPTCVSLS